MRCQAIVIRGEAQARPRTSRLLALFVISAMTLGCGGPDLASDPSSSPVSTPTVTIAAPTAAVGATTGRRASPARSASRTCRRSKSGGETGCGSQWPGAELAGRCGPHRVEHLMRAIRSRFSMASNVLLSRSPGLFHQRYSGGRYPSTSILTRSWRCPNRDQLHGLVGGCRDRRSIGVAGRCGRHPERQGEYAGASDWAAWHPGGCGGLSSGLRQQGEVREIFVDAVLGEIYRYE